MAVCTKDLRYVFEQSPEIFSWRSSWKYSQNFYLCDQGIRTRKMEEADIKACGEMFSEGMGYERENDIRTMLTRLPERCWVATTDENTVV